MFGWLQNPLHLRGKELGLEKERRREPDGPQWIQALSGLEQRCHAFTKDGPAARRHRATQQRRLEPMAGRGRAGQVSPCSELWFSESWSSGHPFSARRLGSDVTALTSLPLLVPMSLASLSRSADSGTLLCPAKPLMWHVGLDWAGLSEAGCRPRAHPHSSFAFPLRQVFLYLYLPPPSSTPFTSPCNLRDSLITA